MPRHPLVLMIVCLVVACDAAAPRLPRGALRLHGVVGQGDLYVDAVRRGPVQPVQIIEGLEPGTHRVELREGDTLLASSVIVVRPGMIVDVTLEASPSPTAPSPTAPSPAVPTSPIAAAPVLAPAPTSRAVNVARPSVPAPVAIAAAPVIAAPSPSPRPEPRSESRGPRSTHATRDRSTSRRAGRAAPPARATETELDALLQAAVDRERADRDRADRERAEAVTGPTLLPERLSTSERQYALYMLRNRFRECGAPPGLLHVEITVSGVDGRVRDARVESDLGDATAACVERWVRGLVFSRFARSTDRFSEQVHL